MFGDEWLWLSEASDARSKRRNRLSDIKVEEVSLVDRAANQRKFLVVKREDSMDPLNDSTLDDNDGLSLVSVDKGDGADDFGHDPAEVRGDDAKQRTIQITAKDAVGKVVREGIEVLMSVSSALRAMKTADAKVDNPLPATLGLAIKTVAAKLAQISESFPTDAAKGEDEEPEKGKQDCPEGQMWDADQGKCVPAEGMDKETKDTAKRRIDAISAGLDGLKKSIDALPDGGMGVPAEFVRKLRVLASQMGALPVTMSGVAKGFVVITDDVPESAIRKAAEEATIHPAQQAELIDVVEKALDDLCGFSIEVDSLTERAIEKNDSDPMPKFVASGVAAMAKSLLDLVEKHSDTDKADCGNCKNPMHEEASKDSDGEGDGDGAKADDKTDDDKGDGKQDCPPGQVWSKEQGKCIPLSEAGKDKDKTEDKGDDKPAPPAAPDSDAMTKAIMGALTKALDEKLDPLTKDIETLKKGLKDQGAIVEKMAGETPDSNAATEGGTKIEKQDREPSGGWGLMDPKEVEALREDDLLF
jgi:hypothetical protein